MHRTNKTIVYVSTYFYPFIGGVENNTLELARQSVKKGFDVHVITSDRRNGEVIAQNEEVYEGIKIHRVKTWFRFSLNLVFYPSFLFKLLGIKADIIQVNYLGIFWHDICLILKRLVSKNTVFINIPHDRFMGHADYPFYQKVIRKVYSFIQKLFLNWLYDYFIEVNPFQHKWLKNEFGIPKEKVVYVPNGIPSKYLSKVYFSKFIEKHNLEEKTVLSYVGRIEKYKGIEFGIRALVKLVPKFKSLVYVIGGQKTQYSSELKKLVVELKLSPNVLFIDDLSEEDKYAVLSCSEIFVSPSTSEAFGISYLEAMSQGNAIVTVSNDGSNFLLKDEVNGYVLEKPEVKELVEKISILLEDHSLRKLMIENNYILVQKYTWDSIVDKYYFPLLQITE